MLECNMGEGEIRGSRRIEAKGRRERRIETEEGKGRGGGERCMGRVRVESGGGDEGS